MRKRFARVKANVKHSHSLSMMKGLLFSLLQHGRIVTTVSRAKLLKHYADSEIAYALGKDLSNPEIQIANHAKHAQLTQKLLLFREFVSKDKITAKGSFTRVVQVGYRGGDSARVLEISLIEDEAFRKYVMSIKPKKKTEKKQKKAKTLSARSMKEIEKKKGKQKKAGEKETEKKVVKPVVKKKRIASKKMEKVVKKSSTAVPPVERKSSFFARLGDRILGRRVQGPSQKGRSTARSGL